MTHPNSMNNHGIFWFVCFSLLDITDIAVEENVTVNIEVGATSMKGENNDNVEGGGKACNGST